MREMTVQDLIDALEDQPRDARVMIAHQPSWPLRERVGGVVLRDEDHAEFDEALDHAESDEERAEIRAERERREEHGEQKPVIVYLVANGSPYDESPYADKDLWNEI